MDKEIDDTKWYKFETLTLFPIDLNLVDRNLLNEGERNWLNDYHKEVFEKLSPHLNKEEVEWMRDQCRAI